MLFGGRNILQCSISQTGPDKLSQTSASPKQARPLLSAVHAATHAPLHIRGELHNQKTTKGKFLKTNFDVGLIKPCLKVKKKKKTKAVNLLILIELVT